MTILAKKSRADYLGNQFFRLGVRVAVVALVLDQLTKYLLLKTMAYEVANGQFQPILPFFNLVLVWNKGVSFGMLAEHGATNPFILAGLALIISIVMIAWLTKAETKLAGFAIGLVIGGALGNVIDRVRFGAVIDFLDFHLWGTHWPAFNIADSAICIGVALLIWDSIFGQKDEPETT